MDTREKMELLLDERRQEAYKWIEAYAAQFSEDYRKVTAEKLIDTAMANIAGGWDYVVGGASMEGEQVDPMFWDKLAIYKNIEIPEERRENFFSCSC